MKQDSGDVRCRNDLFGRTLFSLPPGALDLDCRPNRHGAVGAHEKRWKWDAREADVTVSWRQLTRCHGSLDLGGVGSVIHSRRTTSAE